MSDEIRQLVADCLAGEQPAMRRLVDRFKGPVFGLCYRMLGQWQDAEDAAQETFVRALKSLANWDSTRPLEPWLTAIAANRCRTLLATRIRRPAATELFDQLEDHTPAPEIAKNLSEEIDLALQRVRDDYRQAFLLFHQHELSYAEIAEALNAPVGTIKTWVHRARRGLIERLRERGVVEDSRHELRNL